jgi:hypothetical protein
MMEKLLGLLLFLLPQKEQKGHPEWGNPVLFPRHNLDGCNMLQPDSRRHDLIGWEWDF